MQIYRQNCRFVNVIPASPRCDILRNMPIKDQIVVEKTTREQLIEAFQLHVTNAVEAVCVKVRSRSKIAGKDIALSADEDPKEAGYNLAEQLYAAACTDAGEKKLNYTFTIIGKTSKGKTNLWSKTFLITPNDVESDDGSDDEKPTATKESARLIGDVGKQYVGLLEWTQKLLQTTTMMAPQQSSDREWEVKRELGLMEYEDRKDRRAKEATAAWWDGFNDMLNGQADNITKIANGFAGLGALAFAKAQQMDDERKRRR